MIAAALPGVLAQRSVAEFERLLAPDVRWGGTEETGQTCHGRTQAGAFYADLLASGVSLYATEVTVTGGQVSVRLRIETEGGLDIGREASVVLTVRDGLVVDILEADPDEPEPLVLELLYFEGCPHYEVFLPHLRSLLTDTGVDAEVGLVQVSTDEDAQRSRFLGSPSLRVNGTDVDPGAGGRADYGLQCRRYETTAGPTGTPPDAWILAAVQAAGAGHGTGLGCSRRPRRGRPDEGSDPRPEGR